VNGCRKSCCANLNLLRVEDARLEERMLANGASRRAVNRRPCGQLGQGKEHILQCHEGCRHGAVSLFVPTASSRAAAEEKIVALLLVVIVLQMFSQGPLLYETERVQNSQRNTEGKTD
jgi:hypothetical protein